MKQKQICNTINIGKILRSNTKLNVSPDAVKELVSYIKANLESKAIPRLEEITKSHKRKTIFAEDVIELFSRKDNGVITDE